jgi:hypothetical protein
VSENFSAERASERVHVNNSHPVNTVRAQLAWTHEDAILYSPAWYWLLRGFSGLIRLIPLWQEEDEFIVRGCWTSPGGCAGPSVCRCRMTTNASVPLRPLPPGTLVATWEPKGEWGEMDRLRGDHSVWGFCVSSNR